VIGSKDDQNLVITVLREIRDEARKTNTRLDATVERLDQTVERLDQTVDRLDRLERRQVAMEVRLSTELVAVSGAIHEVRDLLRDDRATRATVLDHETRIGALERTAGSR